MNNQQQSSIWSRLPSFVWLILIVGGIAGLVGGLIGLFYVLSHVEGAASILLLLVAWGVMRAAASSTPIQEKISGSGKQLAIALSIIFFAVMGVAIDQPGNILYNQPIQWLFCPPSSTLERGVTVTYPIPGQTNIAQDFSCMALVDERWQVVDQPAIEEVLVTRLVEYILIGYILLALNRLYTTLRRARATPED